MGRGSCQMCQQIWMDYTAHGWVSTRDPLTHNFSLSYFTNDTNDLIITSTLL